MIRFGRRIGQAVPAALLLVLAAACTLPATPRQGPLAPTAPDTGAAPTGAEGVERGAMPAGERAQCLSGGGTVQRMGMAAREMCVRPMKDAGKACTDSSQCEGRCIAPAETPAPAANVTGTCQRTTAQFGCFGEVEQGRVRGILCVD